MRLFDSYDDYKASKTPAKTNTTTDADRQRRQQFPQLHRITSLRVKSSPEGNIQSVF